MYVCACVCKWVSEWVKDRKREREKEKERQRKEEEGRKGKCISTRAFTFNFNFRQGYVRSIIKVVVYIYQNRKCKWIKNLPLSRISKCSHKMSPINAGVRARNTSLPRASISLPFMVKLDALIPSKLNSLVAQFSQWSTSASAHWRGSVKGTKWTNSECLKRSNYVNG